eukprot:CAMPEP_0206228824 /NCGR_PEP_ID=MMETSP0047_2-20121206/9370_1 /ASSEMBLY_ACC=CAM_ASM_000192 /TAXON_ID=195065 /ORGANISM="Chroomonas mesostigmatica_cf, Strain CCMP1168" /LENGTH=156 /DNA_ID=CAMNT_0053652083 /DNA_START=148 /DNA_END=615 /DNA_ORIENTATION=+
MRVKAASCRTAAATKRRPPWPCCAPAARVSSSSTRRHAPASRCQGSPCAPRCTCPLGCGGTQRRPNAGRRPARSPSGPIAGRSRSAGGACLIDEVLPVVDHVQGLPVPSDPDPRPLVGALRVKIDDDSDPHFVTLAVHGHVIPNLVLNLLPQDALR